MCHLCNSHETLHCNISKAKPTLLLLSFSFRQCRSLHLITHRVGMAPAAQASGAAAKKFTTAVSKPFSMASRPGTKQQSKAPVSAAATTTPFKPAASNPTPKPIANPSKPPTTTATTTNPPTRLQTTKSLPKPPTSTLLKPATPVKPAPNPTTKPPSIFKTSSQPHDLPNWISRSIQSYVQLAGDYAGNTITALGDRVNKMGEAVGGKYVFLPSFSFSKKLSAC